jgi:hypothetical protein
MFLSRGTERSVSMMGAGGSRNNRIARF